MFRGGDLAADLAYVFAQLKLLNLGYREHRRDYCGKRTRRQKRAARLELRRRLQQSLKLVSEEKAICQRPPNRP
jgi:hypothetical protein